MESNIYQILQELESTPGKNDKVDIIKANADNELFMQVLDAALNPYHVYNIKQTPDDVENCGHLPLDIFLKHLPAFENREITGNLAKNHLRTLLHSLSAEDAEVAARIIKKDLRAGFGPSTVNKAVPKFIPVYPCLLATPYSDKALAKIVYPAYSQIKADGMRANLLVNSAEPLRGRSGKTIDLLDEFVDVPSPTKVVLDGELRMVEDDGSWMDRKKGNGLLNKAIRGTITPEIAARARFIAWDFIPWEEFSTIDKKAKNCARPYHERWAMLEQYIEELENDKIVLSENVVVNSLDEAQEHFADAVSRGEEGIIVKNINHRWENRRSEHLVKFKVVEECDLEVIGWSYGEDGKRLSDTMGTLTAASSDRKVIVDVPGYSDELRAEIFENIDDYMGRIITVMYNERISSKTRPNTDSVFLPRFVEFREDKEVADSSEDIK